MNMPDFLNLIIYSELKDEFTGKIIKQLHNMKQINERILKVHTDSNNKKDNW